jgi:hypothetical protein
MSSGLTDSSGNYSITGLFPGIYTSTASYGDSYFAIQEVEVTASQQNFDFEMVEYPHNYSVSYSGPSGEIWYLIPNTISCAIKLTDDELTNLYGTAINQVSFKSPISQADGQLWAQVWIDNNLVSEKAVTTFSYGEDLTVMLDNFVPVEVDKEYFVGLKVQSITGNLAWFDTNPRVSGRGAWFRINSWTEVNSNFNHNFVITAHVMSITVDENDNDISPVVTALGQNYPNPFNPETNIVFNLAEAGDVTLEIYNIRGQKIKTLADANYGEGTHILHWNGTDDSGTGTASGVYFYKMRSGKYSSTKKMILMK